MTLTELLARIEAATGAVRRLDHDLLRLEHGTWLDEHSYELQEDGSYWSHTPPIEGANEIAAPQPYTSSVDAALALVERMLPIKRRVYHELVHGLDSDGEEWWNFKITDYLFDNEDAPVVYGGTSPKATLAILAALIRALIAQEAGNG